MNKMQIGAMLIFNQEPSFFNRKVLHETLLTNEHKSPNTFFLKDG